MRKDGRPGKAWRKHSTDGFEIAQPGTFEGPYEHALARCRRAYETAGSIAALQEALLVCGEATTPLPEWLWRSLGGLLERHSKPPEQDLIDFARYDLTESVYRRYAIVSDAD